MRICRTKEKKTLDIPTDGNPRPRRQQPQPPQMAEILQAVTRVELLPSSLARMEQSALDDDGDEVDARSAEYTQEEHA